MPFSTTLARITVRRVKHSGKAAEGAERKPPAPKGPALLLVAAAQGRTMPFHSVPPLLPSLPFLLLSGSVSSFLLLSVLTTIILLASLFNSHLRCTHFRQPSSPLCLPFSPHCFFLSLLNLYSTDLLSFRSSQPCSALSLPNRKDGCLRRSWCPLK